MTNITTSTEYPLAKDTANKTDLTYLKEFEPALKLLCKVSEYGSIKYSRGSWHTVKPELFEAALLRHALQEGIDKESGLPHLAHVLWNAAAILTIKEKEHAQETRT